MSKRKGVNAGPPAKKKGKGTESDESDSDSDEEDEEGIPYMTVKLTLAQILRPAHRDLITSLIEERSLKGTDISYLASTHILHQVNDAYDKKDYAFFQQDANRFIENSFYGVLRDYTDSQFMHREFAGMHHGNWPNNKNMTNTFKYLYEQHQTNSMNTVRVHREKNVKKFLRIKAYEHNTQVPDEAKITWQHIESALKMSFHNQDNAGDDITRFNRCILMTCIREAGGQDDLRPLFYPSSYFRAVPMLIYMSRYVQEFNLLKAELQQQGEDVSDAPKIENFKVIPLCNCERKHIRFDHDGLHALLKQGEIDEKVPAKKKGEKKRMPIEKFIRERAKQWNKYFRLNKIKRLARAHKFHYQILSDGVAVSVMFEKKETSGSAPSFEQIKRLIKDKKIKYKIGLDPGMRTWAAYVRRCIRNGKEVSFNHCIRLIFNFQCILK